MVDLAMGVQEDKDLPPGLRCPAVLAADEAGPLGVPDEPDSAPPTGLRLHPILKFLP